MSQSKGGERLQSVEGELTPDESPDEPEVEDEEPSLSRDDIFEILSNRRRRFALHHLQQNGERTELGTLSEQVAAWENDVDVQEVSSQQRKRVYTSLQQFHLSKLDDKGVVDFDERAGVVELEQAAEDVDIYLEVVQGNDIPWSQYYLGLAAVNISLLVAAAVGTYPLTVIPVGGWGIFVATTFLVSAVIHTYFNRSEMRIGSREDPPEVEE